MLFKTWEESCKSSKKPTRPKKLPEIADIPYNVIARLPQLPDGWLWVRLGDIADVHGGLTKNQKRNNLSRNMKYLRVANVYADKILADDVHIIGVTDDSQLVKSKALRQSILKNAFSGKLVAQNPNDKPASLLLKRIKAEKAAQSHTTINLKRRRRAITKA